ncbi:hypothetical protein [Haloquadratum walsbyi]|uniref:Uncharacterized protein n=1 Tax=Haloquadratum walsbyi J07HQW2 TaxID=1238425 RepID=U1NI17_9EURY|nr:hypothetical protein [Haloquadratum walsbyi]ERG96825.1 MAG: hypothetical protein J07HQW2_03309 [Haloquadratum walsbyi J07HQW2]
MVIESIFEQLLAGPGILRTICAFFIGVGGGGAVQYQYGPRLEIALDRSMTQPLIASIYGFIAFGLVSLAIVYAYTQLAQLSTGIGSITNILAAGGIAALIISLGTLTGGGFAVLGTGLTETIEMTDPWISLGVITGVAAVGWTILPALLAAAVWGIPAAVGIGGSVRVWIHGPNQ